MAGDWIKFEVATSDKPEVWAIAGILGIDPDAVIGKLLRVWAWFDQHTTDGNAPSVSCALLDRCVGVTGFCDAVTQAGWLYNDGKVIHIPNFDAHNGETAKKRCQTAKRVAKHKKSNQKVTQQALPSALPKEDNREDIKTINQSYSTRAKVSRIDLVERFPMHTDWLPDDEFSARLQSAGNGNPWMHHLDEFCLYWAGRPEEKHNHFGWQNKFLKNILAKEARREANLA